jgi:hypothetical protein
MVLVTPLPNSGVGTIFTMDASVMVHRPTVYLSTGGTGGTVAPVDDGTGATGLLARKISYHYLLIKRQVAM